MDLRRKGCLILLLVLVLVVNIVKGDNNVVFNVKHKYGGRGGSVLNELKAHDSRRHGRMLAAVDFQLGGNGQPTDAALVPSLSCCLILLVCNDVFSYITGKKLLPVHCNWDIVIFCFIIIATKID